MNGNVTQEGIDKDFAWMKRVGIAGVQNFDGSLNTPLIVKQKLSFMSPEWRAAFHHAVTEADRLGLEFTFASSSGWSETGGPWVKPEQAMKKLVWSEVDVSAGQTWSGSVPMPPEVSGPFQDIPGGGTDPAEPPPADLPKAYRDSVLVAYRLPDSEGVLSPSSIMASSEIDSRLLLDGDRVHGVILPIGQDGTAWVEYRYDTPRTMRAVTLVLAPGPHVGPLLPAWPIGSIEASDDAKQWRKLAALPPRGAPQQTIAFPATTAKYFRLRLENSFGPVSASAFNVGGGKKVQSHTLMEMQFLTGPRVNRFEDKAGWSAAPDLGDYPTPRVDSQDIIARNDVIDLSGRLRPDGTLDWRPTSGRWRVLRMGWSLTGKLNNPASPEGTGLEVDKLSRKHVDAYMDHYLGLYQQAAGPGMMGKHGLKYMLTDSYEALAANWTDDMLKEFAERRGYDPKPWLPVLVGRVVESSEASDRFLWDFRRTLADVIADEHYGELSAQLHRRGLGRYGESHEAVRAFVGDGMEVKKSADVPMGATWAVSFPGAPSQDLIPDILESASVAHLYGQNIVAAESFTAPFPAYGFAPENLKPYADKMMASGVNRFVIHTSVHQPTDDPGPGISLGGFGQWFTRKETWAEMARPWMTYLARSSYLLQQGVFAPDIAWFYGEDDNITQVYDRDEPAVPTGYTFDFVNADVIRNVLSVKDGGIIAKGGTSYRMLVLDKAATRMTVPTLRKLLDMVQHGAVLVGAKPLTTPSLSDDPAEFSRLTDEIWRSGTVYSDVSTATAALGLRPDVAFSGATAHLRFVHRKLADKDVFFVANLAELPVSATAIFRSMRRAPIAWQAEDGSHTPLSFTMDGQGARIPLSLPAHGSMFIIFEGPKATVTHREVVEPQASTVAVLSKPWRVHFKDDAGSTADQEFPQLVSWTQSSAPDVRYFSGTASYRQNVQVPAIWHGKGRKLVINLGDVKNVARVIVNGQEAGIAWKPPFAVDITRFVRTGTNRLEIEVANLWPNRLIGDQQPGSQAHALATNNPFKPESPLLPSGLLGPVQLMTVAPTPEQAEARTEARKR